MDRLGVQIDRDFVSTGVPLRTSKGMLSTTEVIYYLANRGLDTIGCLKAGRRDWWCAPNESFYCEPVHVRLTGKD